MRRDPTWIVYVVRHPETLEVRYVGLTTDLQQRTAAHLGTNWGHPVEVVPIQEHAEENRGRLAEARAIAAHSSPRLTNLHGKVLGPRAREALRDLIRERGLDAVAELCNLSKSVVTNASVGFSLRWSSMWLILRRVPVAAVADGYEVSEQWLRLSDSVPAASGASSNERT